MSVGFESLGLYALAMFGLWIVPGPAWAVLIARALAGGMNAAWPFALGVMVGDFVWPAVAITGLAWITSVYGDILGLLRWIAAGVFLFMGISLILKPASSLASGGRLTRSGMWAGFSLGVAVSMGNPKAILFYLGALPGFFSLASMNLWDIVAVGAVSALVPFVFNLILAASLDRARVLLSSPTAIRRMNIGAGILLGLVGLAIPFL